MQMTLAVCLCLNTSNTKVMHLSILKVVGYREETEEIQNELWEGGTNLKLMWQSLTKTHLTVMLRMCMMTNLKGPLFLQGQIIQVMWSCSAMVLNHRIMQIVHSLAVTNVKPLSSSTSYPLSN